MLSKLPTISSSSVTQSGCSGSKQTSEYNMNGPHKRRLFILSLFTPWIFDARPHKHIKARKKRKTLQTHCVSLYRIHNWIHFARADLQTTQWGEGKKWQISSFFGNAIENVCVAVRCVWMSIATKASANVRCDLVFSPEQILGKRKRATAMDEAIVLLLILIFPSTSLAPIH